MDQATIFETTESSKRTYKDDQQDRDRLSNALNELNIGLSSVSFDRAYTRVRQAETRGGSLSETQLRSIVDDVVTGTETLEGVAESFR
jgi:isopropylmalate/homocitrate/citramalate synthase